MFDESADLSGMARISFILRYVDFSAENEPEVREDFVAFVDAFGELRAEVNMNHSVESGEDNEFEEDGDELEPAVGVDLNGSERQTSGEISLTGEAFGQLVLKQMKEMNLPLQNCVGIGTDGCAVMLGEKSGAVKTI